MGVRTPENEKKRREFLSKIVTRWNEELRHMPMTSAAAKLGLNDSTFRRMLQVEAANFGLEVAPCLHPASLSQRRDPSKERIEQPQIERPDLPSAHLPADEIWEIREREFRQKKIHEEAHKLIPIKIPYDGPIGLLHFGDPHVDDDGTDLSLLRHHAKLTKAIPGLWGCNVGDTTNNWIGRLARLYGDQGTSESEAALLAKRFIEMVNWAYLLGGNHDTWFGGNKDIMEWICEQKGALYKATECRLQLAFPNEIVCRINARHDFDGNSMWNVAHGPAKASLMGVRDHINVCGHRHVSGHNVNKDPDKGIAMHAIRVASYKVYDRYKKEKGFRDQDLGPACVTIINPWLPDTHPDFVLPVWDPDYAVTILEGIRRRITVSLPARAA